MYDLATLKAVKKLFDNNNNAKAILTLTQWIAEAETIQEKEFIKSNNSGENTVCVTKQPNEYGC